MKRTLLLRQWLMAVVAVLAGTFSATASTDLGPVVANQDYNVPGDWGTFNAVYVAESASPTVIVSNLELKFYTDAAGTNEVTGYTYEYKNNKDVYTYENLEAGTYYLHLNFVMNDGTFRIETEVSAPAVNLVYVSPEAGVYSPATTDMVTFKFDCDNIKYGNAKLLVGASEYPAESYFQYGGWLNVLASRKLVKLYNAGDIAVGDTFTVRVDGIRDANDESVLYNGNGVAEVSYTLGVMPTSLVYSSLVLYDPSLGQNQTLNRLDSYYRAGLDEALVTLTFSGELQADCKPEATFSIGDPAYETKYYHDQTIGTVNGNTVTFDLSGVARHWKNWPSGLAETTDPAGLKITGIVDVNGKPVYSGDPASPNSFSASLQMNYLEYPVVAVFEPADASEVYDGQAVTIAIANGQHITFDAVKVDCIRDGQTVSLELEFLAEPIEGDNDAVTLSFVLPELGADDDSPVNVSLTNLVCDDGLDYSVAAEYVYAVPACAVELVSPADGATLANIKDAGFFKVNVANAPAADELEVLVRFYDPALEDPQITTYLVAATPEEGEELVYNYAQEVLESYDMLDGVDYTLNVTVTAVTYPAEGGRVEEELASYDYMLHGSALPFVYSEAQLVRISPNPVTTDIISVDQNLITLVFDAPVVVTKAGTALGMGAGLSQWAVAKYEGSTMLDENLEEVEVDDGTVWNVTIPTSVIENSKSSFSVSFWAVDTEGHPVYLTTVEGIAQPNQNKDNTYFNFDYTCTVGAPDFTVEPCDPDEDGFTVVEQLDKIYVSYSTGIDPNWNNSLPVVLYKGKGVNQTVVQEWTRDYFDMWNEDVCVEYGEVNLKWCIALDEPITEPGAYTFVFPNAFFNLGSEYDQAFSRITTARYLINEAVEADNIECDPKAGSTVTSLKTIKITWIDAADASVDWNVTEPVVLYDANNNVVANGSIGMSDNWDDPWNLLAVTLDKEVSTNGDYVLHIPAGKVLLNDGAKSASEQNINYTVLADSSGLQGIAVPTDGIYRVYNIQGMEVLKTTNAADLRTLAPGIYIVNDRKIGIR